jgi:hypothetical protein
MRDLIPPVYLYPCAGAFAQALKIALVVILLLKTSPEVSIATTFLQCAAN